MVLRYGVPEAKSESVTKWLLGFCATCVIIISAKTIMMVFQCILEIIATLSQNFLSNRNSFAIIAKLTII